MDDVARATATRLIIDRATREGAKRIKAPRKLDAPPPKPVDGSITTVEDGRLRNTLFRLTASQTWNDDVRSEVVAGKIPYKSGEKMVRELDQRGVYPPGGSGDTLMRVCAKCGGRWFPPQYIVADPRVCPDGWCSECVENRRAPVDRDTLKKTTGEETPIRARAMGWNDETKIWEAMEVEGEEPDEVPVAAAMMALEDRDAVLNEMPLESEEVGVLKAQIARYLAGKPTTLIQPFEKM